MTNKDKKRVQIQIDKTLAIETEKVLDALGMSPTTLITMLYKRIAANGAIPFKVELTEEEIKAIRNYKNIGDIK